MKYRNNNDEKNNAFVEFFIKLKSRALEIFKRVY